MSQNRALGIVAFICLLIIAFFYHETILSINDSLFYGENDGLKNYFNFAYHIKHDTSNVEFIGMNYPYGESIFMVDCHPLLSNVLRFISQNIVDISEYSVGILNAIMFSSLIICALFLFLLLDWYKNPLWISIIGSVGITFLSSNVLLWQYGHYALTYGCFFPIGWYLLIRQSCAQRKFYHSIIFSLFSIVLFYTHVYLGFIIVAFAFLFHIYNWMLNRTKNVLDVVRNIFIQVVIPLFVVFIVVKMFDGHNGRISMPYVTDYRASLYNIFLPNHSFLSPLLSELIHQPKDEVLWWDRVGSYIGFGTVLILFSTLFFSMRNMMKKEWSKVAKLFTKSEWSFLLSSITLLVYSTAFPFRFDMEYLLPNIMKQFIGLGRFSWPFYFVITVFSFKLIQKIFSNKVSKILMFAAAFLLLSEGLSMHHYLAGEIVETNNLFKDNEGFRDMEKEVDFEKYQAIIPLPYYYGYLSLNNYNSSERNKQLTMQLSYNSGLPLASASLSRPSMIESRSVLELFLPVFYKKKVIDKLNEKPLLIALTAEHLNSLEQNLLKRAKMVYQNDELQLYSVEITDFVSENNKPYVQDFTNRQESYFLDDKSGCYSIDSLTLFYESFDDEKSNNVYRGSGALKLKKNSENLIFQSNEIQFSPGEYSLSFWYYNYLYDQAFNSCWLEVKDKKGKIKFSKYFGPARSNVYHGNWAFNEVIFSIDDEEDKVFLFQKGSKLYSDDIYFDELLIKPKEQDVYRPITKNGQEYILKNNEEILINW